MMLSLARPSAAVTQQQMPDGYDLLLKHGGAEEGLAKMGRPLEAILRREPHLSNIAIEEKQNEWPSRIAGPDKTLDRDAYQSHVVSQDQLPGASSSSTDDPTVGDQPRNEKV